MPPGIGFLFPSPDSGNFQLLFIQGSFLPPSPLSFPSGIPAMQMLLHWMVSLNSQSLFSFFPLFFFLTSVELDCLPSFCLSDHRSFLLLALVYCLFHLVVFRFVLFWVWGGHMSLYSSFTLLKLRKREIRNIRQSWRQAFTLPPAPRNPAIYLAISDWQLLVGLRAEC